MRLRPSVSGRRAGWSGDFRFEFRAVIKTPSICFVIPYFGRWPFWMPLFLESCRRNPDTNWLLFSDCGIPPSLPDNVRVERVSYESYCALISQRLGIAFAPHNAYKLCDIKPALGYIHAEQLQGYDFWAFGDLDVVYGRLREYFTDERLARYDFYSTHARRVSGHLCLLRNTSEMRGLFMKIPRWRERFMDQEHHALDEGAFSRLFLWRKNFPLPLFKMVGLFNPLRRRSEFVEAFSTPDGCIPWLEGALGFPQRWYWNEGKLTNDQDKGREFPYFHFAIWKRGGWSASSAPSLEAMQALACRPVWRIDKNGFSECV